jgi:hypothetical protein
MNGKKVRFGQSSQEQSDHLTLLISRNIWWSITLVFLIGQLIIAEGYYNFADNGKI